MMHKTILFLAAAAILSLLGCKQAADLIVHHGTVYTVDSTFSTAQAFAVKDGRIIAVGSDNDILNKYKATQVVDAGGRAVYPGFVDAHSHFIGYGQSLFAVDLVGCRSWEEAVQRVRDFTVTHPGEAWITGGGWDQNDWPGQDFPTNDALNKAFPDIPVFLSRVDGHAALVNAKALQLARISPGQTISGGEIRTKDGRLTGLLVDNAIDLVSRAIPTGTPDDYKKWLKAAEKHCFAAGLTTVSDCGISYREAEDIDSLQQQGDMRMRMYALLSDSKDNLDRYLPKGPYKTERLSIGGFKFYADGALGSRGACLLEPYSDRQDWSGFLLSNSSHFDSVANLLANSNFQMCTHAIGDSANRIILQVYQRHLKGKNDKRWRIEHAQVMNKNDIPLFGESSIIPSVQTTHATSDMYWAGDRLGKERLTGAYAYRQLLEQNGWLPLGTDFPVEDISPMKTFYAAVFRKDATGFPAAGFQMENALSREQALRGMTSWAAKASFWEKELGSLEPGKRADFVVLDRDIMQAPESEILGTKVFTTYLNGEQVYQR